MLGPSIRRCRQNAASHCPSVLGRASMSVVAVVGLGYVGLPLAVEFGKRQQTLGFDLSQAKAESYKRFVDPTGEVSSEDLRAARQLKVTTDPAALASADFLIVAVPTPVD